MSPSFFVGVGVGESLNLYFRVVSLGLRVSAPRRPLGRRLAAPAPPGRAILAGLAPAAGGGRGLLPGDQCFATAN